MADVKALETKMNDVFGKQAPKMPEGGKKFFVQYLPILTLIGAVLSVLGAWSLWNTAHSVSRLVDWANELSRTYGGETVTTSNMTLWIWLALAFLVVNAVLYFMAYGPLKNHAKRGWDLLFYTSLLGIGYSVVTLFIHGQGFGSFIVGLIAAAIGFWILFQIRPSYLGKAAEHDAPHPKAPVKK